MRQVILVLCAGFGLGLAGLALAAPLMQTAFGYPHGESVYALLSNICHQFPSRSLWVAERPMALCARCTPGYLALGLTAVFFLRRGLPANRPSIPRFALALAFLAPGVTDGTVQLLTAYESTNALRVITGLLGGVGVFMLFAPARLSRRPVPVAA